MYGRPISIFLIFWQGEDYVSVSKELLTQLDGVFGHILNSQRHFVRCLKANKGGDEKDLDLDYIREQLDFFGVKAGYKLHQKFSSTIAFSAFGRKYVFHIILKSYLY